MRAERNAFFLPLSSADDDPLAPLRPRTPSTRHTRLTHITARVRRKLLRAGFRPMVVGGIGEERTYDESVWVDAQDGAYVPLWRALHLAAVYRASERAAANRTTSPTWRERLAALKHRGRTVEP